MASVNSKNGKLFLDFRYQGVRCKEYTRLPDKQKHRKRLEEIANRIEAEILLGQFDYAAYFPKSKNALRFESLDVLKSAKSTTSLPSFAEFAEIWYAEKEPEWRNSYRLCQRQTLDKHLLPEFGDSTIDAITKADILAFRGKLVKTDGLKGKKMSASRINHIMTPLRMILKEGADRYDFTSSFRNIKPLKVPRSDVDPFTLDEVWQILSAVRPDFKTYYTVRFFAALRTAEIDGLKWSNVDFDRRQLLIREASVNGETVAVKNDGSWREVHMSEPVYLALKDHYEATGEFSFVFCNRHGKPFRHNDVTKKIWYPLLRLLGLKKRRPYQTRHTAATLWLAAGESPEWIARQMGHSTTEMLFKVYSRYVPNLTRQDGSAFERLLQKEQYPPQKDMDSLIANCARKPINEAVE